MKCSVALLSLIAVLSLSSALPVQAGLWRDEKPVADASTTGTTAKGDTSKWRSQRFKNYDINSDDKVSKEEFLKDMTADFVNRDEDKNGSLSADEIDFPPGMDPKMRSDMRKRMQEDEIRDQKMLEEMEKRMKEESEKRKAEEKR